MSVSELVRSGLNGKSFIIGQSMWRKLVIKVFVEQFSLSKHIHDSGQYIHSFDVVASTAVVTLTKCYPIAPYASITIV